VDPDLRPLAQLGGRPSKYESSFCEAAIAHCSVGASLTSFAAEIGVSRKTLFNWAEAHPEFAYALDVAKACACRWHEERLRKIIEGDGGPGAATAVIFALKNFGELDFSDKREVSHVGRIAHVPMTYEQAIEEARRRGLPAHVLLEGPE
jgi:hypothetical protein